MVGGTGGFGGFGNRPGFEGEAGGPAFRPGRGDARSAVLLALALIVVVVLLIVLV